jgi:hypothetical protein
MLAIVDAFMFLLIVSAVSAALPALEQELQGVDVPRMQMVRNAHAAMMNGNSSGLQGGTLPFWMFAELALIAEDRARLDSIPALASDRLRFLLPGCAWEWLADRGGLEASFGALMGDVYCDDITTSSGCRFSLLVSFSDAPA